MENKQLLPKAKNLFIKLRTDSVSVLFSEELLDNGLLKKLKKSKYEKDNGLLKLIDLVDNKDFLIKYQRELFT